MVMVTHAQVRRMSNQTMYHYPQGDMDFFYSILVAVWAVSTQGGRQKQARGFSEAEAVGRREEAPVPFQGPVFPMWFDRSHAA